MSARIWNTVRMSNPPKCMAAIMPPANSAVPGFETPTGAVITYATALTIPLGATTAPTEMAFTVVNPSGYTVRKVLIDGMQVGTGPGQYTVVRNDKDRHTIEVDFA